MDGNYKEIDVMIYFFVLLGPKDPLGGWVGEREGGEGGRGREERQGRGKSVGDRRRGQTNEIYKETY